jgi:hypothetical protein
VAGIESLISDKGASVFIDAGIKLIAEKVETLDQASFAFNKRFSFSKAISTISPCRFKP